ncbi:hypothetical protein ABI_22850 [Asticcacaulis biprosthecium C19]|uniref:Uncharacterized protein n=1 Tax=Asticcacaulis biprosthecium C19 TaxID=715226 RepID=F4QNG5_9CAUL|nr:hypothetical protein ABI_22850 [Asticcacaulis biprosthecium C19]
MGRVLTPAQVGGNLQILELNARRHPAPAAKKCLPMAPYPAIFPELFYRRRPDAYFRKYLYSG